MTMHCRGSIGIAPYRFLAKTASDMGKPDGLTVIEQFDLPSALHGLHLRNLCGVGPWINPPARSWNPLDGRPVQRT